MIYIDVDAAVTVPVNIMPLLDDTDFITREVAIAYNQAGMDLVWNFITPNGTITQTAVTPTTAGVYDWTHIGDGMYKIEIPASAGGSINNDTEGVGYFTGICTGVLAWRSPDICFRAAGLNDALIESAYSVTRGLTGTALPAAAADAAGGVPISDAGALDIDAKLANTNEITVARMGVLTDWIDAGRLDTLLDLIKTKTDFLPSATAGAAGGVFIAGTNAATVVTTSLTTTFTGNVTGSVGSVTGAVGSVTGSVGSVAGNVDGSTASVTGAVGSVAGNVDGNVTGSVGSLTGHTVQTGDTFAKFAGITLLAEWLGMIFGKQAGDATALTEVKATGAGSGDFNPVTDSLEALQEDGITSVSGAVGSVTGAVGSVAGNVGGSTASVTGAVGSVAGNVDGNVTGSVGSLVGHTVQTADHTAAIAAIPTTAMRGTDNAALASVATEARLAELDAANIPADIDTINTATAGLAGAAMRGTDSASTHSADDVWTAAGRALSDPAGLKKTTAVPNFTFVMHSDSDGRTPQASETVTAQRSIDGAAFGACANSVTEISNGVYKIDLDAADLNGDNIVLRFTAANSDDKLISIHTET